jgi:hypothetical protein
MASLGVVSLTQPEINKLTNTGMIIFFMTGQV